MPAWFKPKRYGYGATPVTWQGWAIVAAFVGAVLVAVATLIGFDRSVAPSTGNLLVFFAVTGVLVAALWIVTQRTTDGAWRWRWGARD